MTKINATQILPIAMILLDVGAAAAKRTGYPEADSMPGKVRLCARRRLVV